jgi:hypothetical protein
LIGYFKKLEAILSSDGLGYLMENFINNEAGIQEINQLNEEY